MSVKELVLHLTLKKKWFDLMVAGKKNLEYRECKYHWTCRLEMPALRICWDFDEVRIVNGYGNHRPAITREHIKTHLYMHRAGQTDRLLYPTNGEPLEDGGLYYVIELGDILERRNC